MGMVLNWQCSKCNRTLKKVLLPVICSCGTVTNADGTVQIASNIVSKPSTAETNLWIELHNYKYTTEEDARRWFIQWERRIPCGNCRKNWQDLMQIEENKPNFSSDYEFFVWGVRMHNIVNGTLNKRIMSLEEAKKVYNKVYPS